MAAGMLAPVSEVDYGASAELQLMLGLRGAALWPSFAEQLEQAGAGNVELRSSGTLMIAGDGD